MTGFVLALLASASWGISDFLGGIKTRAIPVALVLVVSQLAGMAVLLIGLAVHHQPMPLDGRLWVAIGAGLASLASLGLLYSAMARGNIAVVAPIAASGAILPVVVGFVRGDPISAFAWVGIVLALVGALGASWAPGCLEGQGSNLVAGGMLAFGSAITVGIFFTLIDVGSRADPFWVTTFTRATASVASVCFLATRWTSVRNTAKFTDGTVIALVAIGVTDALAEILFATSSTFGELGVVAVLSSIYPVITVLLAILLLRERMHWFQACAAASALVGVVVLGYASAI